MEKFFITGNAGKFREIKEYIPDLKQLTIENLPEIQSLEIEEIIEAKIEFAIDHFKYQDSILILEDTGLYLDALNGFPGPLIKFMLDAVNNEGIYNLCRCLSNHSAHATTVFGIYHPGYSEKIKYYSATIHGTIVKPKGTFGFGWDPIFAPQGSGLTFGEMESLEEKNKYSMRFRAIEDLLKDETINN